MSECVTGCGRPTRDTLRLCDQCLWEIERALAEMPALLDELQTTITRQARINQRNGSRGTERPIPFHVRASDIAAHTRGILTGWVRALADDNTNHYPADTLNAMAAWLVTRIDLIARHQAAADIHTEITDTATSIRHVIDRPADRIYAGTCNTAFAEHHTCDEPLYAHPGAPVVRCIDCGTIHDVAKRRERMLTELDNRLMTATEIARLAGYFTELSTERSRKLIVSWTSRNRLNPHQHNRDGHPMYPFGDVLRMLLNTPKRERVA